MRAAEQVTLARYSSQTLIVSGTYEKIAEQRLKWNLIGRDFWC